MSVHLRCPEDTPNFYQNEQRFLYDLPELRNKIVICEECGEEFYLEDGIETDEGVFCSECYQKINETEERELV